MAHVHKVGAAGFVAAMAIFTIGLQAQGDPATLIQQKLVTDMKLTKTAADRSDIVTAGDVLLLHKDGLSMCSTSAGYAFSNTYANGVLASNLKNRTKDAFKGWGKGLLSGGSDVASAANNGCPSRKFVAGEKIWITGVAIQKDGILVSTFSDPYKDAQGNDTRYYGEIKFPFVKGAPVPSPDAFAKTVAEVITVVPSDDKADDKGSKGGNEQAQAAPPAAPAPTAPMQAIAPPPPPTDAPPPTIAIGQTKDQVIAGFGQPVRTAKLAGTKEIYFYKDMKVTFSNGKVSNVE